MDVNVNVAPINIHVNFLCIDEGNITAIGQCLLSKADTSCYPDLLEVNLDAALRNQE